MNDTECFLQAVSEYRAAELLMGRLMPAFEDWNTDDRTHVLARAQELKDELVSRGGGSLYKRHADGEHASRRGESDIMGAKREQIPIP